MLKAHGHCRASSALTFSASKRQARCRAGERRCRGGGKAALAEAVNLRLEGSTVSARHREPFGVGAAEAVGLFLIAPDGLRHAPVTARGTRAAAGVAIVLHASRLRAS
jgi:hypothetical protein